MESIRKSVIVSLLKAVMLADTSWMSSSVLLAVTVKVSSRVVSLAHAVDVAICTITNTESSTE
jgi:hypothetical protein